MSEERHDIPIDDSDGAYVDNFIEDDADDTPAAPPPEDTLSTPAPPSAAKDDRMNERLERLGGEPAPVITPEEFARLQKDGQVNIDSRGRVRTARRSSEAEAGVSLRKRRAWYQS